MKNAPKILTTMFVVFFVLQLVFYARLHANNVDPTKLDTYIDNLQTKHDNMFSIAISEKGNPVYLRNVGGMDTSLTRYSGSHTPYRIGELSRLFTAVILMQMADEKMIQMGTPISRFFPEIPNGKNISIEDLLSQRVNILDYLPSGKYYLPVRNEYGFEQQLEHETNQPGMDRSPEFSNANYMVLGLIIEKITHQTYAEVLKQRITAPVGLKNTYMGTSILSGPSEASSYSWVNNYWEVCGKWDLTSIHAAGGIISSPQDLGKFMFALYQEKLISPKYLMRLGPNDLGKGIGLTKISVGNKTGIKVTGMIDGFESTVFYFPSDGICLSILSNGSNKNNKHDMDEFAKLLYGA